MPTYYVSQSTGLNTNNGTSPVTPWQTLAFALGAASGTNPGLVGGDIVYVAPGSYNEAVTVGMTSASSTVQIIGDPLNAQGFPNVNGGIILWWHLTSAVLTATSKNNLSFSNFYFERAVATSGVSIICTTCYSWTFDKCIVVSGISATSVSPNALNWTITKSVVCQASNQHGIAFTTGSGTAYNINVNINDCLIFTNTGGGAVSNLSIPSGVGNGGTVSNCTFMHPNVNAQLGTTNTTNKMMFQNCLFLGSSSFFIAPSGQIDAQYNRYVFSLGFNGVSGTGSTTGGLIGLDFGNARLLGYGLNDFFGSNAGAANIGFGTASGAPVTDLYGVTWLGNPDAGAVQRSALSNFQPPTAPYAPTERNASTITIAPGSTSQSIELYLGATGLTASTSGLAAYYNRTRSADVQITLVARTIGQAWTSGGFAEVNPNTMPGVYRLDIPNEALAAGADDVTVVVRGASGTNGAVMSIKLSSGGLTSAQTAQAVLDAVGSSYATAGSIGHAIQNNNVTAIVGSTAAASELSGALLHNGTDYIDSNLLGGASTRVFVGRFQMTQTGTTQGDIIEAFTTDTPAFELQLFDGDNNLVPVTGATLGLRILDVTSTVVETGTPTIEYGTGGIVRWTAPGTYLSIGCPAGMYRMFVDRTVSGTTTTFGPLQIKVQVQ